MFKENGGGVFLLFFLTDFCIPFIIVLIWNIAAAWDLIET